jgi:3-oxoacyl-[acyl-carrier protein] reductase
VAISKVAARDNVIINNLMPGMFHTAGIKERFAEDKSENYEDETQKMIERLRIPAGRFGEADDLGAICAMFCSQYANYIVGQSLLIDGGVHHSLF